MHEGVPVVITDAVGDDANDKQATKTARLRLYDRSPLIDLDIVGQGFGQTASVCCLLAIYLVRGWPRRSWKAATDCEFSSNISRISCRLIDVCPSNGLRVCVLIRFTYLSYADALLGQNQHPVMDSWNQIIVLEFPVLPNCRGSLPAQRIHR